MQVRPSFVREAALLLADLAGQPDRSGQVPAAGFLEALAAGIDAPNPDPNENNSMGGLLQSYTPFLAQLQTAEPDHAPVNDALQAYAQRLSFGTQFDGLYWPVDMHV